MLASLLIWVFDADLNRLIQLYLVGVFLCFTLSQAGMVVHWRNAREPGWRRSLAVNAVGATVTGGVLAVVVVTKFEGGAWIVVAATPLLILMMRSIHKHYEDVHAQLEHPSRRPTDRRPAHQHFVILVTAMDAATERALAYARFVRPADIRAVTFDPRLSDAWRALAPDVSIAVPVSGGDRRARLARHLRELRKDLSDDDFLTLVVPEVLASRSLIGVLRRPGLFRLRRLLGDPVQVLNALSFRRRRPGVDQATTVRNSCW